MARYYDNLLGFSDLKYEAGNLYGRLNGGQYVLIPTQGPPGTDGEDGEDGASAYIYHAFASDSAGTGFTLVDDGTLAWTSWITTATPITSPTISDFPIWIKRKGVDGVDGQDGEDGRDAYVYVAWASDSSGSNFSMIPSASLPYRAELHTDHVIASPSLSDFSGIPFINIGGGGGTTYTFSSPLSVNAQNVVSIDLTGYLPKNNPTATGLVKVGTIHEGAELNVWGIGTIYGKLYSGFPANMSYGEYTQTFGAGTQADGDHQLVAGRANIIDNNDEYAFIVGNGSVTIEYVMGSKTIRINYRRNAFTVDWNGNIWCYGSITDGSGNVLSDKSEVSVSTSGTSTTVAKYITVDGTEYKMGGGGGLPVGAIFAYPLSVPPDGAYLLNGQTITSCQTLYPDFWGWIQAAVTEGTVRTLTSAQYESELSTYGQCGAFVISGSNIRLPLINGFIQGLGTGTDKGITIAPGLPNITGNIYNLAHGSQISASADGAFTRANGSSTGNGTGGGTTEKILFDASRSSSIYGNSNTVQPPAIKYSYCIQVFNAATELSQQESAQIATALQGKADSNLGNITNTYDYVRRYNIESDGSWVRIWKSGWVEQGGFFTGGQSVQISFLVQFSNVNYTVSFAPIGCAAGDKAANSARVVANTKLAVAMTVCCGYATATTAGYDSKPYCWYACGQGNPSSINQYISEL